MTMLMNLLKLIWRVVHSIRLRFSNVKVSPYAMWNTNTRFGGYNVVMPDACIGNSSIGKYTYVYEKSYLPNCKIGSFCSIARDVRVIRYTHPTSEFVSTCPAFFSVAGQCIRTFVKENRFEESKLIEGKSAIIGNDVWIGENVRIIEGLRIGDGAIIAAGAVVTKDVPPYAIVGGVPAKLIRYRFKKEEIESLQKIQWWNRSDEWLELHSAEFSSVSHFLQKNINHE